MMMPANYSVISANEMVYVDGGAEIEIDLSTLGNNIVTIVGNSFISTLISSTLGVLFGGNYAVGGVVSAVGAAAVKTTSAGKLDILNTVLQFVGLGAATYQLTQKNVSPYATKIFTIEGTTK